MKICVITVTVFTCVHAGGVFLSYGFKNLVENSCMCVIELNTHCSCLVSVELSSSIHRLSCTDFCYGGYYSKGTVVLKNMSDKF